MGEVFKIQIPIAGSTEEALLYNKSRSVMEHLPVEWVEDIMGGEPKIYVFGSIDSKGILNIQRVVTEEEWEQAR